MNTRNFGFIWCVFLFLWLWEDVEQKKLKQESSCHIVLEEGEGFYVEEPVQTAEAGSDMSFKIILEDGTAA